VPARPGPPLSAVEGEQILCLLRCIIGPKITRKNPNSLGLTQVLDGYKRRGVGTAMLRHFESMEQDLDLAREGGG
jgi:GNAT superfamily N-acetyltransferase